MANSKKATTFNDLPLELRAKIWRSALPESDPPVLYSLTWGGWLVHMQIEEIKEEELHAMVTEDENLDVSQEPEPRHMHSGWRRRRECSEHQEEEQHDSITAPHHTPEHAEHDSQAENRSTNMDDADVQDIRDRPHVHTMSINLKQALPIPLGEKTPLSCVNREARSAALQWASEAGFHTRLRQGRSGLILTRDFDPTRDLLMLWTGIEVDLMRILTNPGPHPTCCHSQPILLDTLHHLAVPEEMILEASDCLLHLITCFPFLNVFNIVLNPVLGKIDQADRKTLQRWQVKSTAHPSLHWNNKEGRADFHWRPRDPNRHEERLLKIDEEMKSIRRHIMSHAVPTFELRFVLAEKM